MEPSLVPGASAAPPDPLFPLESDGGVEGASAGVSHLVWSKPDRLVTLLFGDGVEDGDRILPGPFDFDRGRIIEHSPFLTLIRD